MSQTISQTSSQTSSLPPIPLYTNYADDEAAYAATSIAADPQSSNLLAYFQKAAPGITSPDALLGDYKALQVVLGAFGLQDSIGSTGLLRKLLTQDPTQATSLAQQLHNPKYLLFAKALSNWSPPPFASPSGIASIVAAYKTNLFEAKAEQQAPGLQNALYFTRSIGSVSNLSQLQSDRQLLQVVVTGVGLPADIFGALDFDQQTAILKDKVDLSKFQDPAYVKRFAEQYLIAQQLSQTQDSGPPPGSLLGAFSDSTDTSGDSLLAILDPSSTGTTTSGAGNLLSLFA